MSTRFTQARLLTVNEVADLLRVSRMTVYRLIKEPVPTTDMAVVWRPEQQSPALHAFLKIVWEVAGAARKPTRSAGRGSFGLA